VLVVYYSDPESEGVSESEAIALYYEAKYEGVHLFDLADDPNGEIPCAPDEEVFEYVAPPAQNNPEDFFPLGDHEKYATKYMITPAAYDDWIEAKVRCWIESHNAQNDPDILAIVTTRGVQGVITNHFDPCETHVHWHIKGSMESRLASLGHRRVGAWPADPEEGADNCDASGSNSTGVTNPFFQKTGIPFREFVQTECLNAELPSGDTLLPVYLVTRLDAEHADTDGDGVPNIPDEDEDGLDASDLQSASRLSAVELLIDREHDLRTGVTRINSFLATIVVDEFTGGEHFLAEDYLEYLRGQGFCLETDASDDFLHGALEESINTCDPTSQGPPFSPTVTGWQPGVEGEYTGDVEFLDPSDFAFELAHLGHGCNHFNIGNYNGGDNERPRTFHEMAFRAHPAGYYVTKESWAGVSAHDPRYLWKKNETPPVANCADDVAALHSQSINWIAAGGSFTTHSVKGTAVMPSHAHAIVGLYVHGLTWAEAVYTAIPKIGSEISPIGDPGHNRKVREDDRDLINSHSERDQRRGLQWRWKHEHP
jgi:hypothetical protein